jgi:anti-sigma factor RsiW
MITCRELVELLIDFVSGDLPPEHCEKVEKHLRLCRPCVVYVETYRLTIRLTRKLPPAPLPPSLKERLSACLREIRGEKGTPCEGEG